MINQTNQEKKNNTTIYKSLYLVKDKFLPNADLEFLECKDDELNQEALLKMLKMNLNQSPEE
jgi:hypothetical protein